MSRDVRFYKGKYKVAVLSESEGNWVVRALEPFEDEVYGEKVKVKAGETRIVAPNMLFKREGLPPIVKEHTYELKMERQLKKLVADGEKKESEASK